MANAGFIVAPDWRNKGLGWLLGATMLAYAKQLGYRNVIFNLVFSENVVARRLWDKLGFKELGVTPGAVPAVACLYRVLTPYGNRDSG